MVVYFGLNIITRSYKDRRSEQWHHMKFNSALFFTGRQVQTQTVLLVIVSSGVIAEEITKLVSIALHEKSHIYVK